MATHLGVGAGILTLTGLGSPEGVVAAPVSSTYRRRDGSGLTAFYVKQGGAAGVTGWVPIGSPTESGEYLLLPEGHTSAQAIRGIIATYDGGSMILRRRVSASRVIFRLTAGSPIGSITRVMLFQFPDGGSGIAPRVASATDVALVAAGAQTRTVIFAEGTVTFEAGLVYALYGSAIAAPLANMRVYSTDTYDLLSQLVEATTHPTTFTTAISSTVAPPALFNPLPTPGGEATPTNVSICPVLRLRA